MTGPRILVSLVGVKDPTEYDGAPRGVIPWPDGWPVPREGDAVDLPDVPGPLRVRTVAWSPRGEPHNDDPEPFVYVVVGPPRPF